MIEEQDTHRIQCTWIDGRDAFKLTAPFRTNLQPYGAPHSIVIPRGFPCDGASIPMLVVGHLFIHAFHHTVRRAGLVHDYLYATNYNRRKADEVFRNICAEDGANIAQRWIMWAAVRLFGGAHHGGK